MTESFDFAAFQEQGNNAGVPELYLLVMTPLPQKPGSAPPAVPGQPSPLEVHYAYMHDLLEHGKILMIGPAMGSAPIPDQAPVPHGFGVLNVATRAEAEEIARNEPFHVMGWRHNAVLAWTPKYGTLIGALRDSTATGG